MEQREKVAIAHGRPVANKLVGMEMAKSAVERAVKVIKNQQRPALVDVYIQHI